MTRVGRIGTVNPCDHAAAQIRGLFILITGRLSNERHIFVSREPPAWLDDAPVVGRESLKEVKL